MEKQFITLWTDIENPCQSNFVGCAQIFFTESSKKLNQLSYSIQRPADSKECLHVNWDIPCSPLR